MDRRKNDHVLYRFSVDIPVLMQRWTPTSCDTWRLFAVYRRPATMGASWWNCLPWFFCDSRPQKNEVTWHKHDLKHDVLCIQYCQLPSLGRSIAHMFSRRPASQNTCNTHRKKSLASEYTKLCRPRINKPWLWIGVVTLHTVKSIAIEVGARPYSIKG